MSTPSIGKSFIGGAANQTFNGYADFNAVNYAQATGGIVVDLSMGTVIRKFTPSIQNPFKILPVGDSITLGLVNTEIEQDRDEKARMNAQGGYRKFLDQLLIADGLGEAVDFVGSQTNGTFEDNQHEGYGGTPISGISGNIKGFLDAQQPDMLLLMIGTNDTRSDTNPGGADERLNSLLDKITNHSPTTHVLVASVPPIDPDLRLDQSKNVIKYNAEIPGIVEQKLAQGKKVTFVNINSALTVDDIFDGVHPSLEGYETIADSWYSWIESSKDTLFNIDHITGTFYDDEIKGNENDNIIQGGAGNDTFVLALGEGTDTITDFSVNEDSLDLWLDLTFDELSITQGTGNNINDTWITHNDTGEQLALLLGVEAEDVNSAMGLTPNPNPNPTSNVIRINAGGNAYTDVNGNLWGADQYFTSGHKHSNNANITNTQDDKLYQTERWANNLSYVIPVSNGEYKVNVKFAEIYWNNSGERSFDLFAEGQLVIDDLDIVAEVGGKNLALDKSFDVTVSDGNLNLDFLTNLNNAKVAAIEVIADSTSNPNSNSNTSLDIFINGVTQSEEVESYGGASENPDITTTISNNSTELQLSGNGWRRLDITGYQVNADSNLEFEFRSSNPGEVQGIGFDNDNNIGSSDAGRFFQVEGSESWGIEQLEKYSLGQLDDGFEKYSIPIGNLFTGQFNYLTIANDHDVSNPTATGEFRNISLS